MKLRPNTTANLTAFIEATSNESTVDGLEPLAPTTEPTSGPPPIRQTPNIQRRTVALQAELLDRFDQLYARWLYERREVRKDQMWSTAIEEYLTKYEPRE